MQHTSNIKGQADWANELVTPFFTRAQVYAFTIPPSKDVIEKVNKGGQQDYIPHEYIRALLDRYIGAGRWEMRAELHSTDKEVIKKVDYKTKKETENVAATANVNVTLVIHAQDGSDKTLEFSAVGSNTQYAGLDKGFGAIIGNAISSAESLGLKRAATNLGRAFGFDLKSKVKKDELPPSIPELAARLNQRHATQQAANDSSGDPVLVTSATAEPVRTAVAEIAPPAPVAEPVRPAAAEEPARAAPAAEQPKAAPAAKIEPEVEAPAAAATAEPEATAEQPPVAETKAPAPAAAPTKEAPAAAASADPASANADGGTPKDEDWELSLIPTKFEEWLKCIQTMARRINAMTNEREIQNFIRRNKKLIDRLPVIPGTEGKPEKNFKKRWVNIINKRCGELNIAVPAEYALVPA